MSFDEEQRDINETFHKTDFGSMLYEKRYAVVVTVVVLLLSSLSWVSWTSYQEHQNAKALDEIYFFKTATLEALREDRMPAQEVVGAFLALGRRARLLPASAPIIIEFVQELRQRGEEELVAKVLAGVVDGHAQNAPVRYFLAYHLAVSYEDLGKWQEAIDVLESLLDNPVGVLESRLYLDLGRLYLRAGDLQRAKNNLLYVVDNFPGDELANMAEILLQDIE